MALSWRRPLLLAAAAAGTAALLYPGTASAAGTVPLHSAHRGATAPAFASDDCATVPAAGSDQWVFVLPHNDADFVSLTLLFRATGGAVTTVRIPDAADPYPDGIQNSGASKASVVLPSGWTLLNGTATVSGDTDATFFNLTHTCLGSGSGGGPSPSPHSPKPSRSHPRSPAPSTNPPSTPTPSNSGSASVEGSPSTTVTPLAPGTPVSNTGGSLPVTGTAIGGFLLTGLGAIGAGSALLWARRRRAPVRFTAE